MQGDGANEERKPFSFEGGPVYPETAENSGIELPRLPPVIPPRDGRRPLVPYLTLPNLPAMRMNLLDGQTDDASDGARWQGNSLDALHVDSMRLNKERMDRCDPVGAPLFKSATCPPNVMETVLRNGTNTETRPLPPLPRKSLTSPPALPTSMFASATKSAKLLKLALFGQDDQTTSMKALPVALQLPAKIILKELRKGSGSKKAKSKRAEMERAVVEKAEAMWAEAMRREGKKATVEDVSDEVTPVRKAAVEKDDGASKHERHMSEVSTQAPSPAVDSMAPMERCGRKWRTDSSVD